MFTLINISPVRMTLLVKALVMLSLSAISYSALAGTVTVPNSFSAGTPAVASQVNNNFAAVKTAVDDNDGRVAALEAGLVAMQASLDAANATIATLQTDLNTVQNNSVLALDGNLISTLDVNGFLTAQFTGINVQVVNGVDQTTINGLGNMIVGYNAPRNSGSLVCSDGQYTDQTACQGGGETWAFNHKTGSHNLVAGDRNNYSQTGGVVFGELNTSIGIMPMSVVAS
ncbi:hypothetical protein MNBD_GAMMA21-1979 [hydrothermal vent metagenome]|uniref:Uncharacterized protein n=1 Tax=hydrothermal vent metagenome TaxID=652676 RepID=A0A3B1AHT7_9ZZZZ